MKEFTVKIKPLTPIWTGDANRRNTVLRETGIIGSLRWWYEVLVRGLGGSACDPTNENLRCKLDQEKFKKALNSGKSFQEALNEQICPACQLFGCTGWARKFKLEVEEIKSKGTNKPEEILFKFIPLREIDDKEWALLNLTLNIVANYGALGGRTTFKPTDEERNQNKLHHQDFGLIEIISSDLNQFSFTREKLEDYAKDEKWRKMDQDNFKWASIQNFWCVNGRYLSRKNSNESSFNKVLGREEPKNQASQTPSDKIPKWLAGSQKESKKVFSFKNPPRTFGFVNRTLIDFKQMKQRLEEVWVNEKENNWKFLTGNEIISEILEGLK